MNADSYPKGAVKNNSMAVTSLVSAVIAWVIGVLGGCVLFVVFSPLTLCTGIVFLGGNLAAAVTGYMARDQIRQSQGTEGGNGMAQAGLILGFAGLGISIIFVCLAVLTIPGLALMGPQIGNVFSRINSGLSTPIP